MSDSYQIIEDTSNQSLSNETDQTPLTPDNLEKPKTGPFFIIRNYVKQNH